MSDGLDFAVIEHQSSLDQRFTVSGGAGSQDLHIFRKLTVDLFDGMDRHAERVSFVVAVERIEERAVLGDQCGFGRR